MRDKCEHNIDLTDFNDCAECLKSQTAPKLDNNEQDEKQALEDENSNAADEENDSEAETEEADLFTENTIDIDKSNIKDFRPTQAGYIKHLQQITAYLGNPKNDDSQIKVSLFENSNTLGLKYYDDLDNSPSEIIQNFKRERILLLGGSGDENSSRASHQIARSLEINNKKENIRVLDLSYYETNPLSVQSISPERKSSKSGILQDALVIVNAIKEGDKFAGSLLDSSTIFIDQYYSKLKDNKLYMICLIKADSINDWLGEGKTINFPYWIIPDKKDKAQSSEDEAEINRKVEKLLKSGSAADIQIVKIILFIVSFFPNLTTREFNDLVNKWLKNESEATIKDFVKDEPEEKSLSKISLSEVWKSKSRFFTEQCFLKQIRDEQGRRIISFHNELYTERIKELFEENYWAFVDEKVFEILHMRLIFHPSDNVASQSAAILAEYLPGNEENFIDWLLWVFNVLNDEENRAENIRQILGIRDSDGNAEETGKKYFYYNRLAKLFRAVLRYSSLKTTVSNIMERLIQDGCYQSALMLVKRLQYAPNFDESYWLRQLLERGGANTKREIKKYLFNNLINTGINDAFSKLKEWLPQENSSAGKYSQMNRAALELLIKYYSYQINVFDEELYGLEPTRFPLFIFESKSSADEQLDLLVKYLLHPLNLRLKLEKNLGLKLEGMPYIYYAAFLLERWSRILCGNNLSAGTTTNNAETLSNKEILNILLEKVVSACSAGEQEKIKSVWREFKNVHDTVYKDTSDWELREQVVRERKFLTNLIELFNAKQWQVNL